MIAVSSKKGVLVKRTQPKLWLSAIYRSCCKEINIELTFILAIEKFVWVIFKENYKLTKTSSNENENFFTASKIYVQISSQIGPNS